jgi:hypothetical protein
MPELFSAQFSAAFWGVFDAVCRPVINRSMAASLDVIVN